MSLQVAVAVPFRQAGTDRLGEGAFVVALSLDREWFSPDQAKRLVDVAVGRGLLETVDGGRLYTSDAADEEERGGVGERGVVRTKQSTRV